MLRRVLFIASSAIIVLLFAVQAAVHWPKRQWLTVDQVLAWRLPYNDLIGADEKVVVEKFGPPRQENPKLDQLLRRRQVAIPQDRPPYRKWYRQGDSSLRHAPGFLGNRAGDSARAGILLLFRDVYRLDRTIFQRTVSGRTRRVAVLHQ